MTKDHLIAILLLYKRGEKNLTDVLTAVDAYSSASNNGKPHVSGSLPSAEEIDKFSWQWAEDDNGHGPDKYFADCNFKSGAKWLLSKVVGNDH